MPHDLMSIFGWYHLSVSLSICDYKYFFFMPQDLMSIFGWYHLSVSLSVYNSFPRTFSAISKFRY